jgi:hypothetical protein
LIADYLEHERKDDKKWKNVDAGSVEFQLHYDLQAFFDEYKFLNISSIAALSGINASFVRQYAKGIKYPSAARAKELEKTIHELAKKNDGRFSVGSSAR